MLNNKTITILKNLWYSLSSNLISMFVSILVVLIVPKFIGVEEYGYLQVYLFYSSYVGFLHFGWNDGIYLKYGGMDYKELNKELFFSQFWMLFFFQVIIGGLIVGLSAALITDINRIFIFNMISICMVIVNVRFMLIYILQVTNRIRDYAKVVTLERILYMSLIILLLILGIRRFELLIIADLIGKFIALMYSIYCCRDIVINKISKFYFSFKEAANNISIGIKLMFANIAGLFIIGIVRFGIERNWDVSTFGKVSLTLSISNLMMVFISAIGIIMFPLLRRTKEDELPNIYTKVRTLLMVPLLGVLVVYYPLKTFLSDWLPQYSESLMYMGLLFPMCVFEGKISLLMNTFLKTLRKEKTMLIINLVIMTLSLVLTFLFTLVFMNLPLLIVSIVVLLALRAVLAEIILSKILNVRIYKDILLEALLSFIFIFTSWFISSLWIGIVFYLVAYSLYLFLKWREITFILKNLKLLLSGTNN